MDLIDDDAFDDDDLGEDIFMSEFPSRGEQPQVIAPSPRKHPDALLVEASKISGGDWQEHYKRVMGETYQRGFALINEDETNVARWKLLSTKAEGALHPVLLFERERDEEDDAPLPYARIFKVSTVVRGRGERFMWVMRDHDKDTRLAWDASDVVSVQQLETYRPDEGDIDVVKCEVRSPYPLLMSNRLLLGVQQARYNGDFQTHTYVYHTAQHYYFTDHFKETTHKHCVLVPNALVCVWLSPMKGGECRLKMVVCVDAGNLWAASPMVHASYPEKLCERVLLWQRVVNEWDTYYGKTTIQNYWKIENKEGGRAFKTMQSRVLSRDEVEHNPVLHAFRQRVMRICGMGYEQWMVEPVIEETKHVIYPTQQEYAIIHSYKLDGTGLDVGLVGYVYYNGSEWMITRHTCYNEYHQFVIFCKSERFPL